MARSIEGESQRVNVLLWQLSIIGGREAIRIGGNRRQQEAIGGMIWI